MPLYGDGLNVRDWLHVDDHCRGIQLVLEKGAPGEFYNIGGGIELTNKELTAAAARRAAAPTGTRVEHVEDRKGHDLRYSLDDAKLRADGLRAADARSTTASRRPCEWYRDNQSWWRAAKGEGGTREVTERWLVVGAGGQLGTDLMRVLDGR